MNAAANIKNTSGEKALDMMISIKTLGLSSKSIITSIGAVAFDRTGETDAHLEKANQFYVTVSNFDATVQGFGVEPVTINWMKKQKGFTQLSPELMNATTPLRSAVSGLISFIEKKKPNKYWANSPRFHFTYFEGVCDKLEIPFKFDRHKEADFRSLMDVIYPNREDRPEHDEALVGYPLQHALGDAIMQAVNVTKILKHPALQPHQKLEESSESTKPRKIHP